METFKRKDFEKYYRDIFMASVGFKIDKHIHIGIQKFELFFFSFANFSFLLRIWIVWKNIGGVFMEICNGYNVKKLDFLIFFYLLKIGCNFTLPQLR